MNYLPSLFLPSTQRSYAPELARKAAAIEHSTRYALARSTEVRWKPELGAGVATARHTPTQNTRFFFSIISLLVTMTRKTEKNRR